MAEVGLPAGGTLFVEGRWTAGSGGVDEVVNPSDGSVVATVDLAGPDDVDRAVAAARAAFDTRSLARVRRRASAARCSRRVADLLLRDKEQIALTETLDTGKTLRESRIDVDDVRRGLPLLRRRSPGRTPAGWSTSAGRRWSAGSCASRSASAR